MIKNKFVTIKQITHNFNYYKDLGYNVKKGKELIIKVNDLPHTSHIEIIGICDICGKEKIMQYRNYIDRMNYYDTKDVVVSRT